MSQRNVGYWPLLRHNPEFTRLWIGQLVSNLGDWFNTVAVLALVYDLTQSGLSTGLIIIASTLPAFLLTPYAGMVVDRFDRRKIMMVADLSRGVLALGMLLVRTSSEIWLLYLFSALLIAFASFFGPALNAAIPNLVSSDELISANALSSATWGLMLAVGAAVGGVVIAAVVYRLLGKQPHGAASRDWRGVWAFLGFLAIVAVGAYVLAPLNVSVPALKGFNFEGGITLSGEYVSILLGLVLYTGAFITEIVRAGIQAVPRGLSEASRALGLTYVQTLRLVTVPLALRVIIPPLTNQYLNLAKNSSLAVAVAYPDLYFVSGGIYNMTGQTIQVIAMMMGTYLLISLAISALMNTFNTRFKLVER